MSKHRDLDRASWFPGLHPEVGPGPNVQIDISCQRNGELPGNPAGGGIDLDPYLPIKMEVLGQFRRKGQPGREISSHSLVGDQDGSPLNRGTHEG